MPTVADLTHTRLDLIIDEWQRIRDDRDTAADLLHAFLEARTPVETQVAENRARAFLLASS